MLKDISIHALTRRATARKYAIFMSLSLKLNFNLAINLYFRTQIINFFTRTSYKLMFNIGSLKTIL